MTALGGGIAAPAASSTRKRGKDDWISAVMSLTQESPEAQHSVEAAAPAPRKDSSELTDQAAEPRGAAKVDVPSPDTEVFSGAKDVQTSSDQNHGAARDAGDHSTSREVDSGAQDSDPDEGFFEAMSVVTRSIPKSAPVSKANGPATTSNGSRQAAPRSGQPGSRLHRLASADTSAESTSENDTPSKPFASRTLRGNVAAAAPDPEPAVYVGLTSLQSKLQRHKAKARPKVAKSTEFVPPSPSSSGEVENAAEGDNIESRAATSAKVSGHTDNNGEGTGGDVARNAVRAGSKRKRAGNEGEPPGTRKSKPPSKKAKKTASSTRRQTITGEKLTGKWASTEMDSLDKAVKEFQAEHKISSGRIIELVQGKESHDSLSPLLWDAIEIVLPQRSRTQIRERARRRFHNFVGRGTWSAAQKDEVHKLFEKHGGKFTTIAAKINRHPEDVRDYHRNHYRCYGIKNTEKWTRKEMARLCEVMKVETAKVHAARQKDKKYKIKPSARSSADEDLVNWDQVSEGMGRTRTRQQCVWKWSTMRKRNEIDPDGSLSLPAEAESGADKLIAKSQRRPQATKPARLEAKAGPSTSKEAEEPSAVAEVVPSSLQEVPSEVMISADPDPNADPDNASESMFHTQLPAKAAIDESENPVSNAHSETILEEVEAVEENQESASDTSSSSDAETDAESEEDVTESGAETEIKAEPSQDSSDFDSASDIDAIPKDVSEGSQPMMSEAESDEEPETEGVTAMTVSPPATKTKTIATPPKPAQVSADLASIRANLSNLESFDVERVVESVLEMAGKNGWKTNNDIQWKKITTNAFRKRWGLPTIRVLWNRLRNREWEVDEYDVETNAQWIADHCAEVGGYVMLADEEIDLALEESLLEEPMARGTQVDSTPAQPESAPKRKRLLAERPSSTISAAADLVEDEIEDIDVPSTKKSKKAKQVTNQQSKEQLKEQRAQHRAFKHTNGFASARHALAAASRSPEEGVYSNTEEEMDDVITEAHAEYEKKGRKKGR